MQAVFSEQAYQQAVSLKVESLELMDMAINSFTKHKKEVARLRSKLQKAHQYAQGRPDNEVSTQQWGIMLNPERNLLGGFLALWDEKGSLRQVFINENKKVVAAAFNTIIQLESGKIQPSGVK